MRPTLGSTPILAITKKTVAATTPSLRFLLRRTPILLPATLLALTLGTGVARADPAPPPITTPPPATAIQPPAEAIIDSVDPVTPCSGWLLQGAYGGTWPTDSTWWEYTCESVGAADPEGPFRTDYYYWDSAQAMSVYYGQRLLWWDWWYGSGFCLSWWDQATTQWYGSYGCALSTTPPAASFTVNCSELDCSFDASASTDSDGTIQSYTWDFGDGSSGNGVAAQHSYIQSGSYTVLLVVVDNNGAEGITTQAVTVAASPNAPPTASFTATCSALSCSFDAAGSADSDGTITTYRWDLGDGTTGSGVTAQHTYTQADSYMVKLTVTDNSGATATTTRPITFIALTARGYKVKGAQTVDLSWSGSGASLDIFRDGAKIATAAGTGYTDTIGKTGAGRYTYQVCHTTTAICSNQATVTF